MAKKHTKAPPAAAPTAPRDDLGRFPAGVSGNPAGRPVGLRNQITTLNEQLEYAVRREIKADRIAKIIERLVVAAENGSIQAARIVLDKILPNARVGDGESNTTPMIHVIIQNATHGADKTAERPTVRVYEHETPKTDGEIK